MFISNFGLYLIVIFLCFFFTDLFIDQQQKSYQGLGFKKYSLMSIMKAVFSAKTRAALSRVSGIFVLPNF